MTHQKRLPSPKHYPIERKEGKYISTIEGSRSIENSIPAVVLLRDALGYAESKKEAKKAVRNKGLLRNGEPVKDIREGIGVLDVVEIPAAEETYRVIRDGDGLEFVPVTDGDRVAAKIIDVEERGGEYVYRLHSGENYRSENKYSTGNTLILNSSVKEVELEKGAQVLVIDGKHAGETGKLEEINPQGMNPDTGTVENDTEFQTRLENLLAYKEIQLGENR